MPEETKHAEPGECPICGKLMVVEFAHPQGRHWCQCSGECLLRTPNFGTGEEAIAASHRLSPRLTAMKEANGKMLAAMESGCGFIDGIDPNDENLIAAELDRLKKFLLAAIAGGRGVNL